MVKFFVAAGLAVTSATECGTCWEADAVTGECEPKTGKVRTVCSSDGIKMEIDPCVFEGTYNHGDAYVGSDASAVGCQLKKTDEVLEIEHGLEECGTTMEFDQEAGYIKFKNTMNIPSNLVDEGIFKTLPLKWNFQCSYDSSYDITADNMISLDASSRTGKFEGFGEFGLSMSFYDDTSFENDLDSTTRTATAYHQVGKPVNFGIEFQPVASLEFAVTSCEVVNALDTDQVFHLWDSTDELMCETDSHPVNFEMHQTPSPDGSQFFGFSYTGFAFDSVTTGIGQQILKCHIEICDPESEDSACNTGCFEEEATTTTTTTLDTTTFFFTTTEPKTTTPPKPITYECPTTEKCENDDPSICALSENADHCACSYPWEMHENMYYYDDEAEYIFETWYADFMSDIYAGDTIQLSKMCTDEWYRAGDFWKGERALGCEDFAGKCNYGTYTPEVAQNLIWDEVYVNQRLIKREDGTYLTFLNCPQCGCTLGQNDAITWNDIYCIAAQGNTNTRSMNPRRKWSEGPDVNVNRKKLPRG